MAEPTGSAAGIALLLVVLFKLIITTLLPPFVVALVVHLNLPKRYGKKKWLISIAVYVVALLLWLMAIKWLGGMFGS